MSKIDEAIDILTQIGMPKIPPHMPYSLLALASLDKRAEWSDADSQWMTIRAIMDFMDDNYGKHYAPNSRESIRKGSMHPLRMAAIVEDNTDREATNSSNYGYKLTEEALKLIRSYKSGDWEHELDYFLTNHGTFVEKYSNKKKMAMHTVKINGEIFSLSSGDHNELQKAIIEEFAPRFAPDCECLYIGDSTNRDMVKNEEKLAQLGFEITLHDKMPDVVLYREDVNWLYFIEAVTSVGPMNNKRIFEINEMTKNVSAGKIYVTAFLDFETYKRFSTDLAWETEVWLANNPDHMIHLNGNKFLGPRT